MTILSVIIPCHNDGVFLADAINSIVVQQEADVFPLPEVEIIVVDDSSTDAKTVAYLQQLPLQWRTARVIKNQRKKGVSGARNTGIDAAKGDWVAFLDADDVWTPRSLMRRWRVACDAPSAEWVAGDYSLWHPDGTLTPRTRENNRISMIVSQAYLTGKPITLERPVKEFISACLVLPSGVMLRRRLFDVVGRFNESMRAAEDYELWLRLARITDLHFVPHDVFHYRQREGSLSHREGSPTRLEIEFFQRLLDDCDFEVFGSEIRRKLAEMYLADVYFYRQRRERGNAVWSAMHTVRWQPLWWCGWKQLVVSAVGL